MTVNADFKGSLPSLLYPCCILPSFHPQSGLVRRFTRLSTGEGGVVTEQGTGWEQGTGERRCPSAASHSHHAALPVSAQHVLARGYLRAVGNGGSGAALCCSEARGVDAALLQVPESAKQHLQLLGLGTTRAWGTSRHRNTYRRVLKPVAELCALLWFAPCVVPGTPGPLGHCDHQGLCEKSGV